jgi:ketosteroid isomerase-like protein
MATIDDVDRLIEQFRLAQDEFLEGNAGPTLKLFSHREDVTLCNPLGPPAVGWAQVAQTIEHAASLCRDGNEVAIETVAKHVTPELAYLLEIQRGKARFGGSEDTTPFALRVTMIFRPEDGVWKIVHRHADPITTAQPVESIIQK